MKSLEKIYEFPICPICMEEMKNRLCLTPCGHVFHTEW